MVLADLEYHQNKKLNDDGSVDWFQRSVKKISEDLFREYGPNRVRAALQELAETRGYIERHAAPIGDREGDYYRLRVELLNDVLRAYEEQRRKQRQTPSKNGGVSHFGRGLTYGGVSNKATPPKMEGSEPLTRPKNAGVPLQIGGPTPPKSGGILDKYPEKQESSRSRSAPAAPAARDPVDPDTDPVVAIIREHYPTNPPIAKCREVISNAGVSDEEFVRAVVQAGEREKCELRRRNKNNPIIWVGQLCDVAKRLRATESAENAIAVTPATKPPPDYAPWGRIKQALQKTVSDVVYQNWVAAVISPGVDELGRLRLIAPNAACKEWIESGDLKTCIARAAHCEGFAIALIELPPGAS